MRTAILLLAATGAARAAVPAAWPYWPEYHKTSIAQLRPQSWRSADDVIDGWDWSLPPDIEPAPNSLLALERSFRLNRSLDGILEPINLPLNPTVSLWINWSELEPQENVYAFDVLRERIVEAQEHGYSVVLRILTSAVRFAPGWLADYGIPTREEKDGDKVINYDVSNPAFHERYIRMVDALGKSGIPQMEALRGAYVGYSSSSFGDEGIGPHDVDPDTVPHVIERLDAWARAFKGVEWKVFMGGISRHGLDLGFGIRRGFVEMYLYHIPDQQLGQLVDKKGYLWLDDTVDIIRRNVFQGEENEEYEEAWATARRGFRFGENTDSYTYRYFTSNLRLLQMRCNYVLYNSFSIIPEQLVWVGQSLGRTVEDTPDIWCALRESYVRSVGPVKNLERWLYQRDSEGYETEPALKIDQPIHMWMVEPDRYYDYIARRGRRIGLAVDDRWCEEGPVNIALKVTYVDAGHGTVDARLTTDDGIVRKTIRLEGTGKLKTATFFIDKAVFPARGTDYDIVFRSNGTDAVLSFVRIVRI